MQNRKARLDRSGERHGVLRQAVARVVYQVRALAVAEAGRADCVQVGVLLPEDILGELEAWVEARGGEVVR